jgi:hypothetical protein
MLHNIKKKMYFLYLNEDVRKKVLVISFALIFLLSIGSAVYAFIQENGKVKGTTFKVSSTPVQGGSGGADLNNNLKLLKDLAGTTGTTNLTDELAGPTFENLNTAWKDSYPMKLYNQGEKPLKLISAAEYVNDQYTLRDDIFVKISAWNDVNNNAGAEPSEIGSSYGYNSILRMKNDTFNLGNINPGEVRGVILEFDGTGLSESNAGQTAMFDFVIKGEEIL